MVRVEYLHILVPASMLDRHLLLDRVRLESDSILKVVSFRTHALRRIAEDPLIVDHRHSNSRETREQVFMEDLCRKLDLDRSSNSKQQGFSNLAVTHLQLHLSITRLQFIVLLPLNLLIWHNNHKVSIVNGNLVHHHHSSNHHSISHHNNSIESLQT
jgi:hypothetical protein